MLNPNPLIKAILIWVEWVSNDMTDMSLKWEWFEVTPCWINLVILNFVFALERFIKIAHMCANVNLPYDAWRDGRMDISTIQNWF